MHFAHSAECLDAFPDQPSLLVDCSVLRHLDVESISGPLSTRSTCAAIKPLSIQALEANLCRTLEAIG